MIESTRRLAWIVAGAVFFVLGVLGLILPLMPGTVFMILAAFCFARGSQRVHDWLVNHRVFGAAIRDWRQHGAISRRGKVLAMLGIGLSFALSVGLGVPPWAIALQAAALGAVSVFLLTRPEGPQDPSSP